ncbi:MAG: hypothetical protein GC200_01620 [Tepidisphaera sp.]|nr:hypothetical protein [Tepidisphaera sp.]
MFSWFSNMPRPVQALSMLAGGAGIYSVVMALVYPTSMYKWIAIALVAAVVVLLLFKGVLILIDKSKSGPFANLLTKSSGRGTADPAQKARVDDLRKKFEEGVTTFKAAGKDLYSLPWFLLVGPSGSGKTEAMRHCNVGFPPGLQDLLQGTGGTLNMNWWFTNHAVVLDTAGRMFMEEGDGGNTEWKELLKNLKAARPNAPINGMLLVISSESLLKDSAEKIEQTAGAIARQLDVVQRTLDVRFPVFVFITKCDKIVGFRDFFETINSPDLQHQMLGWSNPSPLDEAFKPDQVDKHLETVRQKLMRRRLGLLQNPVHTGDPNLRRTDQVDELFELPDNLVRIAPRLRRYLEMIFVAGEWSPKPLFLRGIYFTSSMREGQALDMSLASALGVDVESIPGGKEWDKEKAYFLRDVFLSKVFKEKGLVTRATNVSKALAKQRLMLVGGSLVATLVAAGLGVYAYFGFKGSIGRPSAFWEGVSGLVTDPGANTKLPLFDTDRKQYTGQDKVPGLATALDMDDARTRVDLLRATTEQAEATSKISVPFPASIFPGLFGLDRGLTENSHRAQRAVVDLTVLAPAFDATRDKLKGENDWSPQAVAALAQLVRLQTYAFGKTPASDGGGLLGAATQAVKDPSSLGKAGAGAKDGAIDADALYAYIVPPAGKDQYDNDARRINEALRAAYPKGLAGEDLPAIFQAKEELSSRVITDAVDHMSEQMTKLALPGSDMDKVQTLINALDKFRAAELQLQNIHWLAKSGAGATDAPKTYEEYKGFRADAGAALDALEAARQEIDSARAALGDAASDPAALLAQARQDVNDRVKKYFQALRDQVPASGGGLLDAAKDAAGKKDAKAAGALGALAGGDTDPVSQLRSLLEQKQPEVESKVKEQLAALSGKLDQVSPMLMAGRVTGKDEQRAYQVRADAYAAAGQELKNADTEPEGLAPEAVVQGLQAALAAIDSSGDGAKQRIDASSGWTLLKPSELKAGLDDAWAAAARVSKRTIDIAGMRRRFLVASKTIAAWPHDKASLESKAAALTQARVKAGVFTEEVRRPVPLSSIPPDQKHKDEFYAQTGKAVLGAFAELRAIVEGDSTGQARMLAAGTGAGTLAGESPDYRAVTSATLEYAKDYLAYWKDEATSQVLPSVATWDAWRDGLRAVTRESDIDGPLLSVRKDALDALGAVPKNLGVDAGPVIEEVKKSFAGLDDVGFKDKATATLQAWRELTSLPKPDDARTQVLRKFRSSSLNTDLLQAYRVGVSYWDEFYLKGLDRLVLATKGDLENARNTLMSAKGPPLAFVAPEAKDLSPQDVLAAAGAWDQLRQLKGASTGSGGLTDEKVLKLVHELEGATILSNDDITTAWLGHMGKALALFAPGKSVHISQVQLAPADSYSGLPGKKAIDEQWGAVLVDGKKLGETFNIGAGTIFAATAKQLTFDYAADPGKGDYGKQVVVALYDADPGNDASKLSNPKARLEVPGNWGLLGAGLRDAGRTQVRPDGTWRVAIVGGGYSLVLDVTFDPPLPAKEDWPDGRSWPGK